MFTIVSRNLFIRRRLTVWSDCTLFVCVEIEKQAHVICTSFEMLLQPNRPNSRDCFCLKTSANFRHRLESHNHQYPNIQRNVFPISKQQSGS